MNNGSGGHPTPPSGITSDTLPSMGSSEPIPTNDGNPVPLHWRVYNHDPLNWTPNLRWFTGDELPAGGWSDASIHDVMSGGRGVNYSDLNSRRSLTACPHDRITLPVRFVVQELTSWLAREQTHWAQLPLVATGSALDASAAWDKAPAFTVPRIFLSLTILVPDAVDRPRRSRSACLSGQPEENYRSTRPHLRGATLCRRRSARRKNSATGWSEMSVTKRSNCTPLCRTMSKCAADCFDSGRLLAFSRQNIGRWEGISFV